MEMQPLQVGVCSMARIQPEYLPEHHAPVCRLQAAYPLLGPLLPCKDFDPNLFAARTGKRSKFASMS